MRKVSRLSLALGAGSARLLGALLLAATFSSGTTVLASQTVEYVYDALGRVTEATVKNGSTVLSRITYDYDAVGNRVQLTSFSIAPTANPIFVVASINGSITIYAYNYNTDPSGTLNFSWVGEPTNGASVNIQPGGASITVSSVGATPTTFGYTFLNGQGASASSTITVGPNHLPVAGADAQSTPAGVPITFNPLGNDTDVDPGHQATLAILGRTNGIRGTTSNTSTTLTYTPSVGFFGSDSFNYYIRDASGGSTMGTVNMTILGTNHAPTTVAHSLQLAAAVTGASSSATIDPTTTSSADSDVDGGALFVAAASNGAKGTVSRSGNILTYSASTGYVGADSFVYNVMDVNNLASVGTVNVSLNGTNTPPTAVADSLATPKDTSVSFDPRVNDSDAEGGAFTINSIGSPANGRSTFTGTSITYTPNANFVGTDSFSYRIRDVNGAGVAPVTSSVATITISVTP